MKHMLRIVLIFAALVTTLPLFAICQKCNNNHTMSAMCWTIDMCELGATMSACIVQPEYDENGQETSKYCDPVNTTAGPECNKRDASCGGGGNPGGGGTGGGGGGNICIINSGQCPPECAACIVQDRDIWA